MTETTPTVTGRIKEVTKSVHIKRIANWIQAGYTRWQVLDLIENEIPKNERPRSADGLLNWYNAAAANVKAPESPFERHDVICKQMKRIEDEARKAMCAVQFDLPILEEQAEEAQRAIERPGRRDPREILNALQADVSQQANATDDAPTSSSSVDQPKGNASSRS